MSKRKSKTTKKYVRLAEPINAKALQAFGLRLAEFSHRDVKTILQVDDAEPLVSLAKQKSQPDEDGETKTKVPDPQYNLIKERSRAIAHGKLVRTQGERLRKWEREQWPPVKPVIIKSLPSPSKKKPKNVTNSVFKFTELPLEIRAMILVYCFSSRSVRKQSLLEALRGHGDPALYASARKIWCQESDFHFTLEHTRANDLINGFDHKHMDYLRRATIVISKTITPSLPLASSLLRANHLSELKINIFSHLGFNKAIDGIISGFRNLRVIKARVYRSKNVSLQAFMGAKKELDYMLDWKGKLVFNSGWEIIWVWDLRWDGGGKRNGRKVFEPRRKKKHIKFSVDGNEWVVL